VAAAVPCLLVLVLFAASGAATLLRGQPLIWAPSRVTLSEAVAMSDLGESIRLLTLGADPNARYELAGVFRSDAHATLTPLEAAVLTRELYMMDVVVDHGARIDERNTRTLQCLARAVDAPAVAEYLAERSTRVESCEGVVLPWEP
jgi:hypothetical protein